MTNGNSADEYKRMFEDAVRDLAWITEAIGLDPDEAGGAEPIINAIEELKERALSVCADGGKDSSEVEELVRYCPGCGSIGPVEAKYRDCCPDGSDARMVPEKFAQQCRDTFKLAISAIAKEKK